tara:strand:+ start:10213 stop:10815 length:603 start_codon:yes stop_codon:yes gene_type:complete
MPEAFDWKLAIGLIASFVYVVGLFPYIRDIFAHKTKPHIYTWLIWILTQGTAIGGLIIGGGGFASIALVISLLVVGFIFLLSFKYGTRNITRSDTITLIGALIAIGVWWQLDNPLLAILMVSAIDALGYIPTFRKTYVDPWSETKISWLLAGIGSFLIILSIEEYNFLTATYVATLFAANTSLYVLIVVRRKFLSNTSGE